MRRGSITLFTTLVAISPMSVANMPENFIVRPRSVYLLEDQLRDHLNGLMINMLVVRTQNTESNTGGSHLIVESTIKGVCLCDEFLLLAMNFVANLFSLKIYWNYIVHHKFTMKHDFIMNRWRNYNFIIDLAMKSYFYRKIINLVTDLISLPNLCRIRFVTKLMILRQIL